MPQKSDRVSGESDAAVGVFDEIAEQWRPEPATTTDTLTAVPAQALAALFDVESPVVGQEDPLPPLWHWLYFPALYPQSAWGEDGHPTNAAMVPPIPNRRRMFGGGRLRVEAPLRVGDTVERHAEVVSQKVRQGSSGPLLIVTVRSTFSVDGDVRCVEEQDLVYLTAAPTEGSEPVAVARPAAATDRSTTADSTSTEQAATTGSAPHAAPATNADQSSGVAPGRDGAATPAVRIVASEVVLFRFSALTWNSHRIHYDQAYATGVEGHPALVVHGPLLALLALEVPRRAYPDRVVASFSFRSRRPLYVGDVIEVGEQPAADARSDRSLDLVVSGRAGIEAVHASVEFGARSQQ